MIEPDFSNGQILVVQVTSRSEPDTTRQVDLADDSCTCPDWGWKWAKGLRGEAGRCWHIKQAREWFNTTYGATDKTIDLALKHIAAYHGRKFK